MESTITVKGQGSFADAIIGALGAKAGCVHKMTFDRKTPRHTAFRLA